MAKPENSDAATPPLKSDVANALKNNYLKALAVGLVLFVVLYQLNLIPRLNVALTYTCVDPNQAKLDVNGLWSCQSINAFGESKTERTAYVDNASVLVSTDYKSITQRTEVSVLLLASVGAALFALFFLRQLGFSGKVYIPFNLPKDYEIMRGTVPGHDLAPFGTQTFNEETMEYKVYPQCIGYPYSGTGSESPLTEYVLTRAYNGRTQEYDIPFLFVWSVINRNLIHFYQAQYAETEYHTAFGTNKKSVGGGKSLIKPRPIELVSMEELVGGRQPEEPSE